MTFRLVRGAAVVALLVCSLPALADPAPTNVASSGASKKDVSTLLFNTPQWDKAPVGSKLRYGYEKTVADAALGTGFKDEVVLTLGAGDNAKSRTTEVQLFSGANRKPAGPFRSDEQNPVLLVMLEANVQDLSKLFKANPRYLKNAIRKAWREKAKIEPATLSVDGKSVQGTRISVTPFKGDAEADKMKGLSDMSYVVEVSDDVPGAIATIDIHAPADGKARYAEVLKFTSLSKGTKP